MTMGWLHRPVGVWAMLIGLTGMSVGVAELGHLGRLGVALVFAAAACKGQLIAVHFMETPRALPVWNSLYRTWVVAVGVGLCVGVAFAG